jgi:hypothetical protein
MGEPRGGVFVCHRRREGRGGLAVERREVLADDVCRPAIGDHVMAGDHQHGVVVAETQ